MCELFAISSKKPSLHKEQLSEFFSHSKTNPDGWGLFWMDKGKGHIVKEAVQARKSQLLKESMATLPRTQLLFAHIREATSSVCYESCHPFSAQDSHGTTWTLMHNGYLLSEAYTASYSELQVGTTDSERVFLFLLDYINEHLYTTTDTPSLQDKLNCLEAVATLLTEGGANKLNLIISDGEYIFVHTNTKDATLLWKAKAKAIMIATKALDTNSWGELQRNRFLAFKEGELVAKTQAHSAYFKGGEPISFEAARKNGQQNVAA